MPSSEAAAIDNPSVSFPMLFMKRILRDHTTPYPRPLTN
jgi:hypothetical protein